jgi:hypothetical protein
MTIVITDDCSRADLAETLALLNLEAKALSRRGYTGLHSAEYARWHDRINAVLTDWQNASA